MTIRYANGQTLEAVLVSRAETTMRVVIAGCEDSLELSQIHGVWVTEDCEPVELGFSWGRSENAQEVTEADCVCPPELASRLTHMLHADSEDAPAAAPSEGRSGCASGGVRKRNTERLHFTAASRRIYWPASIV
ncbi:MAG TPA: hypothetical protein VMA31_04750 [Bryobacteraceae bacterium]|nr:hypothetical protein [Bryobacteraceae bacterium]